jgi:hypothetical protein
MSVISFLNDLGIIPNEGTGLEKDANLLQGQKYMEYGRMYAKSVNNNLTHLQETSSPKVHSVIEALHGMDSLKKSTVSASTDTSAAENEFNKTMAEYSTTYKLLSADLMKKQNDKTFKINPALYKKLDKLNNKLISLSSKIGKEVHHSSSSSSPTSNIKEQIKTKHKELQQHIDKINKHHRSRNEDYEATLDGQKESTELNSVSNYYFYLFWLIFSILLITTTTNVLMNNSGDNNSILIIILIIILIGVYFFK